MSKMTNNKLAMLALAGLGAFASGPAFAAGMTVDTKGGLEVFELDENNYWFKIGGRLFFDQAFFDADDDDLISSSAFPSGAHIRAARVTLKGGVGHDWVYKFDIDLKDKPGSTNAAFGEAFIGYSGCKSFWVALGQVSIPFGLENWQSGNDNMFMELSLATSAFAPDKGLGLYAEWHGHWVTAAAALYHPQVAGSRQTGDVVNFPDTVPVNPLFANPAVRPIAGTGPLNSDPGSDDVGFGARITFSPVHDDYTTYHAGIAARYESLHEHANNFNYIAGYEVRARQTPILFTNIPPNSADSHDVWGFELAGQWGPLLIQGEYMLANVERDEVFSPLDPRAPGGELDYYGYYVQASYVLTGEKREYDFDSGTIGAVHPDSRKGAWEIGVRHSFINFVDNQAFVNNDIFEFIDFVPDFAADQFGVPAPKAGNNFGTGFTSNDIVGSAHSTTIGLTWWVNDNVRFLANYVRTSLPFSQDVDAFGLRGQVNW
jgi:phosphate-selective porin OprO/OprP